MLSPDQKEMFDVLEQQHKSQRQVDRILKFVLPVMAFLLTVICANLNVWSTVFTFFVLWIAFIATGIKNMAVGQWVVFILVYCLIDNFLSYGSFNISGFSRQFGTMFIFLGIVAIGRPYIDRWFLKSKS
ncbi:hypothetical protein CDG60_01890 [Acinetobacter chinensis]|jgi:hypothetical protein|uniref:Uncharacterized protein n=1 Tax=Acinetobacter chinensis TaxID=2004650 RepID=A0A3B7LRR0_9GAMM|nr:MULTISPECIES: hypothetical protein [Acinetobacter]AXY55460.1 hypothetical protein CDG60_01890 [Acinetobacter chinensis]AXY61439.1 hypothetical protein CDG61_16365 [Acinetobacter sp. WCHAc010052]MDV2470388.1 hypothetical protein [Acinetobacter chinensis]WOE41780.1 hypothetical protein QSG87_01075 [Acinetobacter chinensis]